MPVGKPLHWPSSVSKGEAQVGREGMWAFKPKCSKMEYTEMRPSIWVDTGSVQNLLLILSAHCCPPLVHVPMIISLFVDVMGSNLYFWIPTGFL